MTVLAITYPNSDRSLLTPTELRAAAGSNSISDPDLAALGDYISAAITRACQVTPASIGAIEPTLREEGVTELFRVRCDQTYLALARKPVVEINSVLENDSPLDAADYEVDGTLLYKLSGSCRVCWARGSVEVDYIAGYETVPADLKYAASKFIQAELVTSGRDPLLKVKTIEGVSSHEWWVDPTRESIVPGDVMDILYRGGYVTRYGWMK